MTDEQRVKIDSLKEDLAWELDTITDIAPKLEKYKEVDKYIEALTASVKEISYANCDVDHSCPK